MATRNFGNTAQMRGVGPGAQGGSSGAAAMKARQLVCLPFSPLSSSPSPIPSSPLPIPLLHTFQLCPLQSPMPMVVRARGLPPLKLGDDHG